jgi:hypothetical protein
MTGVLTPRRLWFGVLVPPAAWIVQGLSGWFFGARMCGGLPPGAIRTALGLIGAVAVAAALAGMSVSRDNWREARAGGLTAEDGFGFLAFGGIFIGATFAMGTGWATLSALLIRSCGAMR